MKTMRDYEALIRSKVEEINEADQNWTFTVKSFAKDRVRIRWSYLDYLQEKSNCFILTLEYHSEDDDYTLTARTPDDEMIDGYIVSDRENRKLWQETFENSLIQSIKAIARHAHTVY